MIEIALIIRGASLGLSVAKYSGLLQDKLKLKVEQLAGSEFEAGVRALQQAAASEREQQHLLREARSRFNKAISLEAGFRLVGAYLGLALCHSGLGDTRNAEMALEKLIQVPPPEASLLLKASRVANKRSWWEAGVASLFVPTLLVAKLAAQSAEGRLAEHEETVAKLRQIQTEAQQVLDESRRAGERDRSALSDS